MKYIYAAIYFTLISISLDTHSQEIKADDLENYQVNNEWMISAGQPSKSHFKALKDEGLKTVIDLRPGDRSEEQDIVSALGLSYHNIQVDWNKPTLDDFASYVAIMNQNQSNSNKTLTHCQLNWRGAVFTYLYRVTQLQEKETIAKRDLLAIWTPNETWQTFIDDVKAAYKK